MPDTYSPNLAVRLPATGAYNNTWGATLNTDTFTLLDQGIAGRSTINLGAATSYDFPAMVPGGASVSRSLALLIVGTPSSAVVMRLDSSIVSKFYVINNGCGQELEFSYGGGGHVASVTAGEIALIYADGTNVDLFAVLTGNANAVQQVSRGGTGVTTLPALLTALGIPSDISGLPSWDVAPTGGTLVERDGSGYINAARVFATYFNQASSDSENPPIGQVFVESGGDGYLRKASLSFLGATLSALSSFQSALTAARYPAQSLTPNGYVTFPNGFILQWGEVVGANAGAGPVSVVFPLAFPNACFVAVASSKRAATGAVGSGCVQNIANTNAGLDKTGMQVVCDRDVDGVQRALWIAVGN